MNPAVTVAVLIGLSPAVLADDAKQVFDNLYGPKMREVKASASKADDIAFAEELIAAAQQVPADQASFAAFMCDQAHSLVRTVPRALETGISALKLRAELLPEKRVATLEQIAALRNQMFLRASRSDREVAGVAYAESMLALGQAKHDAGDFDGAIKAYRRAAAPAFKLPADQRKAIQQRITDATATQKQSKRRNDLIQKIEADPDDKAAARELALLYVVEQDDPAKAEAYASRSGDATLASNVGLAVGPITEVNEQAALTLGEWYRGLARTASKPRQPAMLNRAHRYYQVYLQHHTAKDFARTKAELAMRSVEKSLAAIGLQPPALEVAAKATSTTSPRIDPPVLPKGPATWVDVTRLIQPAQDAVSGTWAREGEEIVARPLKGKQIAHKLIAPIAIQGDYDLRFQFTRTYSASTLVFPVGDTYCTLVMTGSRGGLESIGGKSFDDRSNPALAPNRPFRDNTTYQVQIYIRLKGQSVDIRVEVDNKPFVKWNGDVSDISTAGVWRLPRNNMLQLGAISGATSSVKYKSIQVKSVSGSVRALRETQTGVVNPAAGADLEGRWRPYKSGGSFTDVAVRGVVTNIADEPGANGSTGIFVRGGEKTQYWLSINPKGVGLMKEAAQPEHRYQRLARQELDLPDRVEFVLAVMGDQLLAIVNRKTVLRARDDELKTGTIGAWHLRRKATIENLEVLTPQPDEDLLAKLEASVNRPLFLD